MLWYLENYLRRLQDVSVPFFFVLSGYLFFRNYSWRVVWIKYRSRLKSLLIPYIVWCTLYFLIYLGLTHMPVIKNHMNMQPVPLSFVYYLSCLWNSTYTTLWFVKSLLLAIVAAPLVYAVFSVKKSRIWDGLSVAGSILLLGCLLGQALGVIKGYVPTQFLNLYFLYGGFLAIRCKRVIETSSRFKKGMGIAGCLFCVIYAGIVGTMNTAVILVMIASLWFAADVFSMQEELPWWMRQTFFIYCAHSVLLEALEKLWLVIAGKSVWAASIDYFLTPLLVLGILAVTASALYRFLPEIYGVLTGGRGQVKRGGA